MNFSVITLGCKVNSYESDFIKEKFKEKGYEEVKLQESPDVIVINTCSVTNQSDAKSRHMIRLAKRESENAIIVVCGCSAENHREELLPLGIDILLGNKDKSKIVELVEEFKEKKTNISRFYDMSSVPFEDMMLKSESDKTRAFVKIQDGCDNFCAYCIIPFMRGNIRSKDIDVATREIEELVKMGHNEIVLTGIHTGSYGRGENYDLVDLIRRISKIEALKRIRISSIEVTELDDKFMEELAVNPKICDHLHIPLQTGSDEILKYMNRKYDTEYFYNKIKKIRDIRPNISITTDLIVGFPHEQDKNFKETVEFIKKIKFTKIHTFPFSLRNGTKAEEMKDYFIDETTKKERVHAILELSAKLEEEYYSKFVGQTLDVIVETEDELGLKGHTSNYMLVHVKDNAKSGEQIPVKITSVDGLIVNGTIEKVE